VSDGYFEVKYVRTNDKLADIFTKALSGPKFIKMGSRTGIGLVSDFPSMRVRKTVENEFIFSNLIFYSKSSYPII
jgi:hypothetical protein